MALSESETKKKNRKRKTGRQNKSIILMREARMAAEVECNWRARNATSEDAPSLVVGLCTNMYMERAV